MGKHELLDTAREAFGPQGAPDPFFVPLTGHDRCDVRDCGAQAYVRVEFKSGVLLFCGHHATANMNELHKQSVSVHDEREKIGSNRLDVSA